MKTQSRRPIPLQRLVGRFGFMNIIERQHRKIYYRMLTILIPVKKKLAFTDNAQEISDTGRETRYILYIKKDKLVIDKNLIFLRSATRH
jgi:hypothetical protein